MALERKDVRAKLDPEIHADLVDICEVDGVDIAEFVERLIIAAVRQRFHEATLLVERKTCRGRSGINRESPAEAPVRDLPFSPRSGR